MKKLFLIILCIFIISKPLYSFNFFPENISYCSKQEYEILLQNVKHRNQDDLRMQNISKDFLWHLKIPTVGVISIQYPSIHPSLPKGYDGHSGRAESETKMYENCSEVGNDVLLWDLAPKKGEGIKIAVLDTKINNFEKYKKYFNNLDPQLKSRSTHFENTNKIEPNEKISVSHSIDQKNQNLLSELMKKNNFFQKCLITNHGELTCNIIWQIAPDVTIIPISIMGSDGYSDIKSLKQGLQQALDMHVDIVHLGLKITHEVYKQAEYAELTSLLQKFPYVVAAAGNDCAYDKKVAYPANVPTVISIGALQCQNNTYCMCPFSQWQHAQLHFLLPGYRILCPLWIDEIQDYIFLHTSGTSMAAALMTGFLALCLAEFKDDFTKDQMIHIMKSCSKKIHNQDDAKVQLSTVNMRKTIATLKSLQKIKKRSHFSFKKNFCKIVQANK